MRRWIILMVMLVGAPGLLRVTWAQQPVFRIGVLDEARGALTLGAQLAVDALNTAGGVEGADGTRFRLELVVRPLDGGTLADAAAELAQEGLIAVIGPTDAAASDLAVLQGINVPVLTPSQDDTLLLGDTSGRIFRLRAPEQTMGRTLANFLKTDLGVTRVATAQLDLPGTAGMVGFTQAAGGAGISINPALILPAPDQLAQMVNSIVQTNPPVTVVYGAPDLAGALYLALRSSGWGGLFVYNQAEAAAFRGAVDAALLPGILGITTWSYSALDTASGAFLGSYVRAFGAVPGAIQAAAYDAVTMMAAAIRQPGALADNLRALDSVNGVQGTLRALGRGETSDNVMVTQLGAYGAPVVLARFSGGQRVPVETPIGTPMPTATATPDGVVVTVKNNVQNVRSGPGMVYPVIGELRQGDTARVVGANGDLSWVVIDFRGQQGWMATYLLDVFGDLNSLPIVQSPPTPTPLPVTPTSPAPPPNPDIVITGVTPLTITRGVAFSLQVTVRNQGGVDAGPFAVATSLLPDNVFTALNLPSLAAGQQTVVALTGTVPGVGSTGQFQVAIIADLNNQVAEGTTGEANNNTFLYAYVLDRPTLTSGTVTLNVGSQFDLEGALTMDLLWTGSSLDRVGVATLGLLTGFNFANAHYDAVNPGILTQTSIAAASLPLGATVGVITVEGRRAVVGVTSIVIGGQLTLTYRVYP